MKTPIGHVPKESGFKAVMRKHQGWWRECVLKEVEGQYWDDTNKIHKPVCNLIENGEKSGKNFLSKDIEDTVLKTLKDRPDSGSGIIKKDRWYNNLLSSQPLAFNFFGFFKAYPDVALGFLQTIRPDIIKVDVVFEYAPESSTDSSAFDVGFMVWTETQKGFVGLEVKYTDTFSYRRSGSKVNYGDSTDEEVDKNYDEYYKIYDDNPDRYNTGYFSYVRENKYNQLFRNEILAARMLTEYDFVITGLFCHYNDKAVNAGLEFQKKIGNGKDDFILLTYSDYFERMQKLELNWETRELVMMLWARYCGLDLSKNVLENV